MAGRGHEKSERRRNAQQTGTIRWGAADAASTQTSEMMSASYANCLAAGRGVRSGNLNGPAGGERQEIGFGERRATRPRPAGHKHCPSPAAADRRSEEKVRLSAWRALAGKSRATSRAHA